MKKIIILAVILSAIFLAGCATNNQTTVDQVSNQIDENNSMQTETDTSTDGTTKKTNDGFLIPEAGIKIVFPDEYTVAKSNEVNRRGSFVSYEFANKNVLPLFQEIQFFSEDSIKKFTENCSDDSPCFFGDYPDLTKYYSQKNAFNTQKSYSNYELKRFTNRYYFVSNFNCTGDSCVIREYTTFLNDTKVDVWITMENDLQATQADQLFEKFEIVE